MELRRTVELFKNWKLIDEFHDKVIVDDCEINVSGFACQNHGDEKLILTGSAGSFSKSDDRALYELLERLTLFEAKEGQSSFSVQNDSGETIGTIEATNLFKWSDSNEWREAFSNGVAIHRTKELSKEHATKELLERDAILASWFGLTKPKIKTLHFDPLINDTYIIKAYELPTLNKYVTAVAVAVPKGNKKPILCGFACDTCWDKAMERAYMELIQRIGFLIDEPIEVLPEFQPSALFHQEFYLQPENETKILSWLDGDHFKGETQRADAEFSYIEFKIPELKDMVVMKAMSENTIPLIFGKNYVIDGVEIDESRYIHPIA